MRGEELGGGRDILGRDLLVFLQAFKDLVFLFRDVELVKPANDFHVLAGVGRHGLAGVGQHRVARQQVVGHEEFGVVGNALKQVRHGLLECVALGHHQQAVGLLLRVVAGGLAAEQRVHPLAGFVEHTSFVNLALLGVGQDLGLKLAFVRWRDHTHFVVAVQVHEAQGAKAVEPGVGHFVEHLLCAGLADLVFQLFDGSQVFAPGGAVSGQHQRHLGLDLVAQQAAGVLGKAFEFGGVHQSFFV